MRENRARGRSKRRISYVDESRVAGRRRREPRGRASAEGASDETRESGRSARAACNVVPVPGVASRVLRSPMRSKRIFPRIDGPTNVRVVRRARERRGASGDEDGFY